MRVFEKGGNLEYEVDKQLKKIYTRSACDNKAVKQESRFKFHGRKKLRQDSCMILLEDNEDFL